VDGTFGSGEESRAFAMAYGASPDKAMKLPHAIDVDHFSRVSSEAKPRRDEIRKSLGIKGLTFIYVGRLWWGKGINFLFDAFRDLQESGCSDTSLLIVGDGPDEQKLRAKAEQFGLRNVILTGFIQKNDLPVYYAASDVFVFPTLGDPYGLVVDEAMACSLPVISTSAAGEIRERIENGINGFVVPPRDSRSMNLAMRQFCIKTELVHQMAENSRKKIADHTPDNWASNFERIVAEILVESSNT
jgi:glycosyltransferase involved in cell wall biosynthesis